MNPKTIVISKLRIPLVALLAFGPICFEASAINMIVTTGQNLFTVSQGGFYGASELVNHTDADWSGGSTTIATPNNGLVSTSVEWLFENNESSATYTVSNNNMSYSGFDTGINTIGILRFDLLETVNYTLRGQLSGVADGVEENLLLLGTIIGSLSTIPAQTIFYSQESRIFDVHDFNLEYGSSLGPIPSTGSLSGTLNPGSYLFKSTLALLSATSNGSFSLTLDRLNDSKASVPDKASTAGLLALALPIIVMIRRKLAF